MPTGVPVLGVLGNPLGRKRAGAVKPRPGGFLDSFRELFFSATRE
jgi:hypothetical protein